MIKGIVAVPKYAARLTLVPPGEDVKEVSPDDVFVVHGGFCKLREPGEGTALQGHGLDQRLELNR